MFSPDRLPRLGLWLLHGLLLGFLLLATLYNLLVPIAEGPDELQHIRYIDLIVNEHRLPNIIDDIHVSSEVIQPPLYYGLMGLLPLALDQQRLLPAELRGNIGHTWAGIGEPNTLDHSNYGPRVAKWTYILRMFSAVFGIATVGIIFACGLQIWNGRLTPALLAAGLAAFTPQFAYATATVTNDIFATFWCAVLLWLMLKIVSGHLSLPLLLGLGIASGLGALTKYTVLPIAVLVVPLLLLQGPVRSWGQRIRDVAIFGITAACIGGWWFVRNIWLYGDLTASGAMETFHAALLDPKPLTSLFWLSEPFLRGTFESYWGKFGSLSVPLPTALYQVFYTCTLICSIGLVIALLRDRERRPTLLLLLVILGTAWMAYIFHNSRFSAVHGRLLYPALPAINLMLAAGCISLIDLLTQFFRSIRRGRTENRLPGQALQICVTVLLMTMFVGINLWILRRPIQTAFNLQPEPYLAATAQDALPLSPPICCETSQGQTFMAKGRLMRIDVVLRAVNPLDQRRLVFHLRETPNAPEDLRTVVIGRDQVAMGGYQRIEFAPVDASAGQMLYFELEGQDSEPGGVTARYSASDIYPEGERYEGGQPAGGDLQFVLFYND